MASGAHGENLIIYYNDCIDSDNMAAALALQRAMHGVRGTRVLWILEPRQVALGLAMTGAQIKGCQGKIKEYFPTLPNPFKVLLGGLLSEKDIAGVPEADRELVSVLFPIVVGGNPARAAPLYIVRLSLTRSQTCSFIWLSNLRLAR
jgi:hypothetical protein